MIFELSESQDNTKVYRDNITSMKMKIEVFLFFLIQ